MKRNEVLRKLEERLARGEISEKTFLEIKARYEAEPEEPEPSPEPNLEASIREAVTRATEDAARTAQDALRMAGDSLRAMDFSGMGARLSDEAIRITGSGTVSGQPVRTREFRSAGSARVVGSLEAEEARIAGSCDIDGDVQVTEFRTSGSTRIAGGLRAKEIEASGSLDVAKSVTTEEFVASGGLRVGGDVTAQEFHASGAVKIGGTVKAQEVRLELQGSSAIGAIQAQEVEVRATGGFVRFRGDLTVDRVEAEEVRLEATRAAYVKGADVRIGPHCHIDVVEAHDLVVHESSEVKERQVPNA